LAHGRAEIGFARRHGATRLAHLYQRDPLRVLFPARAADEIPTAVLVTTSGGLVAGDRLDIAVRLGPGAMGHITASAAEKVYRSTGAPIAVAQTLGVEAGGWLEFLPPETILFDRARLHRETRVSLADGAGFLGGDILVFGRHARGECLTAGLLREVWEIRREGALIWGDALHVGEDVAAIMTDPACFSGAEACATLILVLPAGNARQFLDMARQLQSHAYGAGLRVGATAIGEVLIARWLGPAISVRRAYAELACHLRAAAMGLPPRLPRLWHV